MTYFINTELTCPACDRTLTSNESWVKDGRGKIMGHGREYLGGGCTSPYWYWTCDVRQAWYIGVLKWLVR